MRMNVRAGGTEDIGRGREMGRRGLSCALRASIRAGATLCSSGGLHFNPGMGISVKCFLSKDKS